MNRFTNATLLQLAVVLCAPVAAWALSTYGHMTNEAAIAFVAMVYGALAVDPKPKGTGGEP